MLFYGRFLLHALFEDTQQTLLQVIAEQSRPGDVLALEFRGQADAERPKLNRLPYRRFLDAAAVSDELRALGFVVCDSSEGIGMSPLESEDPYLHRLLATRSEDVPAAGR